MTYSKYLGLIDSHAEFVLKNDKGMFHGFTVTNINYIFKEIWGSEQLVTSHKWFAPPFSIN